MLTLLGMALFIVVMIIIALACWVVHYLLVILPKQQKDVLDQFSPQVVNQVALEYAMLNQIQQRQIAEEKMRDVFAEFNIPSPGDTTIEAKIGDMMYRQKMNEDHRWIEELKADQLSQADTTEMIALKVEEWVL